MILKQKSTFLDPFLLKYVCHHFDSKPLRWTLKLFGLWNQAIQPVEKVAEPESVPSGSFAIKLDEFVPRPVALSKVVGVRSVERRHR